MRRIFCTLIGSILTSFFSIHPMLAQWGDVPGTREVEGESGEEILVRQAYYYEHRAGGPGKIIPNDAYTLAVQSHLAMPRDQDNPASPTSQVTWQPANPVGMFYARTNNNFIAGRTNFMVFHPTDATKFYCAAAGGGVWKTTDGGSSWSPLTDFLTSLASGGLALDPNNPTTLYYGTGEQNYSSDSWYGDGIFKSIDEGTSWTKVATTAIGQRFSQIVVDPTNSNIVYAAGSLGVFKSTNAGTTWNSTSSGNNANCLILDPTNTLILYTTTGGSGVNTTKKSIDGGITWIPLMGGLPSDGRRTQLAMAPSNPSVLYASIANSSGGLYGLYRTTDSGTSWTLQASTPNYMSSQGWYDNAVCVHPTDTNTVIVGGLDIYKSTTGGTGLVKMTNWSTTTSNNMSHADIHFLQYAGSILFCGSDGGVYISPDNALTWSDLNATLSTLQYQSADYDPTNIQRLYGGTQDNNLETSTNGGADWIQRTTGDGGYSIVDPVQPNYVYGQYVQGSLKRSSNYGVSFTEIAPTGSTGGLFYNPYEMAPSDHNTVIYCEGDVWKTTSVQSATTGSGWTQLATSATVGGSVSAIGISHVNPAKFYIGTSNGRILATTDNGTNWITNSGFNKVSDFAVDPANDDVCYATFTGFTSTMHVYKTINGGATWSSVTGNLPNIPTSTIVLRSNAPRTLFVGTDLGVYKSTDDGATWVSFNNSLPTATVYDLKYKEGNQILLAATHGRGCWTFDYGELISTDVAEVRQPTEFALHQNYPNPFNPATIIRFQLPGSGFATLKVFDVLGREVATLASEELTAGKHERTFNAVGLSSGAYLCRLQSGNMVETRRLLLLR